MLFRLTYLFSNRSKKEFLRQLSHLLGFYPGKIGLYAAALTHRSVKEKASENNERLEYLGDAILGGIIADYLYMKYPYKGEGFLTEMRSKMVNRQTLNEIAIKMGLKRITSFNNNDGSLRTSQIFGNALEAVVGAIYVDKGYAAAKQWVQQKIILPYLFVEELESVEINQKNKLFSWANRNGRLLEFETLEERIENGRRLFTVGAVVDGEVIAEGKAFNKKDAGQIAAQQAVERLSLG
ncbi:MAG: ribonuclease III [Bacteroidetes bacterium]|nr:ribonuclease III [Bacteroidota bacterium]